MISALTHPPRSLHPLWAAIAFVLLTAGCSTPRQADSGWESRLAAELPVLGHRNWIVVADSAYPAQTGQGIETVFTGTDQLSAVATVLATLGTTAHVRPVVHLDAELAHVPEALAPGIEDYRTALDRLLEGLPVVRRPHLELIERLDAAGQTFRILIFKTDLTLPYTSVFLELDCAYWGPAAEAQLRAAFDATR